MDIETISVALNHHLFALEGANVFAVLDGASIPDLLMSLYEREPEHVCLYLGELEPDMAEVAPYLVQLERDSDFTRWLLGKGWAKHWGVFAQTYSDLREMRQHLRKFLTVYSEEGQPLLFRYYDPRVLRVFLPTCTEEELTEFFGPVEAFLLEGEEPDALLRFRAEEGELRQDSIALAEDQALPAA